MFFVNHRVTVELNSSQSALSGVLLLLLRYLGLGNDKLFSVVVLAFQIQLRLE